MAGAPGAPFSEQLRERLGPDYRVEKFGCGGTRSKNWVPVPNNERAWCAENHAWMLRDLFPDYVSWNLPADLMVLMLGTNDAQFAPKLDPRRDGYRNVVASYRKNIQQIVDGMLKEGAGHILLLSPPKLDPRFGPRARLIKRFREQLIQIARSRKSVDFGPDIYQLLNRQQHFLRGPHPNLAGHRAMAAALYEAIRALHLEREARAAAPKGADHP